MSKVLLVTPAFHGYWRSIVAALRRLGHDTEAVPYDALTTAQAKLQHKLTSEIPAKLGWASNKSTERRHTAIAARAVREFRPDVVITIKGDTLTDEYWETIESIGARQILWLYDEYRRTRWTEDSLRRVSTIISYSHDDVATLSERGFVTHFLANAFDPNQPLIPHPVEAVTFVGARHPNREALLVALHNAAVPVRAFGRDWSHHAYDRLRTLSFRRPPIPSSRDIPLAEAWGVMAGSIATINLHQNQDGFTMRTFEACGVGAVQLLDRGDVTEFYDPGVEVAVFDSPEEAADLCRRAQHDDAWAEAMRRAARARTLAEHTFDHRMRKVQEWWG